ncbi:WIAG-tail domain [Paenibacillus cisolokensis]|uniref:WIAG-tail domain n=1 Tax=Paenibacillus cisolokensis TaxID=1658519 RepID=UPI003D2B6558
MNKARRIAARSSRRPYRHHAGPAKQRRFRAPADAEPGRRRMYARLYEDTVNASHLQHRSVRSEAIENYAVHSIHLSPESITTSKIALASVEPEHLSFNPVQGAAGKPLLQQFGCMDFAFPADEEVLEIAIPFEKRYADNEYTLICSSSSPGFHAWVLSREAGQAVVGVRRLEGAGEEKGLLHWIAVGWS